MLFNSYEFLFFFLPIVLALYYALGVRARVALLTLASYLFYAWWDYRFCSLLLISTVIDYVAGRGIHRSMNRRTRKLWLILSIVTNLSLLGFFKYFDLFASTLNEGFARWLPDKNWQLPLLDLVLPVGISFYTFQSMSYSIDIYRGHAPPARSFLDFACYVSLFPQLVAGPIIRYRSIADQLVDRTHTVGKAALGIAFFVCGLAKKVLLADGVATNVGLAFGRAEAPDFWQAWIGVLSYAMQIYFDFSGYSDMAVGLGLLFGFTFPQNFHSPYKAASISEFWRRWHISLSTWLRDYLYIPLGGNRISPVRTYVNLLTVMLLGGLWHGANWTFMLWGAYHGVLLAVERALGLGERAASIANKATTFLLVSLGWVIFRAADLDEALRIYGGLLGIGGISPLQETVKVADPLGLAALLVCGILAWFSPNTWEWRWTFNIVQTAALFLVFVLSIGVILVNASSPFLYFQF